VGWALANVWYDKYPATPPPNSPLESVFMLVALRRMEAEALSTRALLTAALTGPEAKVDPAVKAYEEYADKVLPFLANAQDVEKEKEKAALLNFMKTKARLKMSEVYKKQAEQIRNRPQPGTPPKKFNLRPKMPT